MTQIENKTPFGKSEVGEDRFNMFRCIVAMAHADNIVTEDEQAYIQNFLDHVPFSEEQRETLLEDLKYKKDAAQFLNQIKSPEYRGQVVYFARLMAYKDGDFDEREERLLEKLRGVVIGQLDMEQVHTDLTANLELQKQLRDEDKKAFEDEHSFFGFLGRFFGSFGKKDDF